jgi:hypothetical protein
MSKVMTILSVILVFILNSCVSEHSEIVLAKYGNYKIKLSEFEKAYEKNAGSYEAAKR